jgi:serine/threonine protein kinase
MADDSSLPSPGDVLAGKYRIERLVGRGGMGAVFAAQHILLNQRVAVKLLLGELANSTEATGRFMNEARAAAQIQGEHVARVLDIGQLPDGMPYMVLEYLEGSDFSVLLKQRGFLTVPEVADCALQVLDALGQAHAAGIVHRDLKPANLFLARRHDGTSVVKVLDFGISKNLSPLGGAPQGMTQTRSLLGSPQYMSPEQLRTPRGVDARTDIWSMGVILYELLTGAAPFTGEAIGELFMQIMEQTPLPLRSHRAEIPVDLEAIVMRCLSRDPNGRFANVNELAAVLRVFASAQMRALMSARGSSPGLASTGPNAAPAITSPGNTAAPWANTGPSASEPAGLPDGRRGKVVAIIGAGIFCAIVAVVGVIALVEHGATPASSAASQGPVAPLPAASSASPPAPTMPAVTLAPVTDHDAAADDAPKAQAATAVGARVSPGVSPRAAGAPGPTPPKPPAATPAPNGCDPNYYFDKDGHKHFKPECF